jgi:hypothetical protein
VCGVVASCWSAWACSRPVLLRRVASKERRQQGRRVGCARPALRRSPRGSREGRRVASPFAAWISGGTARGARVRQRGSRLHTAPSGSAPASARDDGGRDCRESRCLRPELSGVRAAATWTARIGSATNDAGNRSCGGLTAPKDDASGAAGASPLVRSVLSSSLLWILTYGAVLRGACP